MFDALRRLGRTVECLMFDDDGHADRQAREPRSAGPSHQGLAHYRVRADAHFVTNP